MKPSVDCPYGKYAGIENLGSDIAIKCLTIDYPMFNTKLLCDHSNDTMS